MQGNTEVKAGLEQLINALCCLMAQYMLDAINMKRLGLSIGGDLCALRDQCEEDMTDFIRWLYFYEGSPEIGMTQPAKSHTAVPDIINDAGLAETAFVQLAAQVAKTCVANSDFAVLHAVEHAIKFHTIGAALGSTARMGHLAWLQKQGWQLKEFGQVDYEETKV